MVSSPSRQTLSSKRRDAQLPPNPNRRRRERKREKRAEWFTAQMFCHRRKWENSFALPSPFTLPSPLSSLPGRTSGRGRSKLNMAQKLTERSLKRPGAGAGADRMHNKSHILELLWDAEHIGSSDTRSVEQRDNHSFFSTFEVARVLPCPLSANNELKCIQRSVVRVGPRIPRRRRRQQ